MIDIENSLKEYSRPFSKLRRIDRDVSELSLAIPIKEATALEEAAAIHGLTVAQLIRRLICAFLGESSRPDAKPEFRADPFCFSTQQSCQHSSVCWQQGKFRDSLVCQLCSAVIEEGWTESHPDISRWLSEGGR
ncbi:MAG: hypothetical protein AB7K24_27820 [Gemmataceae bacterium]